VPAHNVVLTFIGASLLWVGWFGFNAGSAVTAGMQAGMAMTVTQIATAVAALTSMFSFWLHPLGWGWFGGSRFKHLLLNPSERRNGRHFLRFQLFRLLGFTIAVSVLGPRLPHGPAAIIRRRQSMITVRPPRTQISDTGGFLDSGTINVEHVQQ
jgi:Ammonium Transporter Family